MFQMAKARAHEAGESALPVEELGKTSFRLGVLISHPIQYFAPLFRRLAQRPELELEVLYCSSQGAGPYEDLEFKASVTWDTPLLDGYPYHFVPNYWPGRLGGFFSRLNPGIVRKINAGSYDAVLVFGWAGLANWLAFAACGLSRTPWMLYGESVPLYESENGWLKARVKKLVLGCLFRKTAAFLLTGAFNREFYESYRVPLSRCFPVPMVVDNDFFSGAADQARGHRDAIRTRFGIRPETVLLLFVGKLIPRKRPQDLLAVLERVQPAVPELGVAFAGTGQMLPQMEAEVVRRGLRGVFFLGFKNQTELPPVYAMADIFVLPSARDNRGVVTNEAMACGLPVVVSDRTGLWGPGDIVRHHENGFVYPAADVDALSKLVLRLANDPILRSKMGTRSREIIRQFSYEQCVDGILNALDFVTARGRLRAHAPQESA
jgi:glycosyltransferase involved in cell wall biosynthesis